MNRLWAALSFRNVSALYVFAALFVVFALWVPETFLSLDTWRSMLDNGALTTMAALALVIPLAAGALDLAVGMQLCLANVLVARLLTLHGLPMLPAILLTLLAGATVGLGSGLLIVKVRIDSFVATLAVGSVLTALAAWISDSQQILGLSAGFQKLGTTEILGVTSPVWIMLVLAAATWYVLERTLAGRWMHATGGNADAARLAGVPTGRVIVLSLVAGGSIAAAAGVLSAARIGVGDPTIGPSYLLPAFAAAALGSTQFRGGRYNAAGTVVAVYVLAAGVKGLQLAGAPVWIPDLFNGLAIILAVGLANYEGTAARAAAIRGLIRRAERSRPPPQDTGSAPGQAPSVKGLFPDSGGESLNI